MNPGIWLLLMAAGAAVDGSSTPPVVEGPFDFVVETTPYSNPSPEGPFDFVVEV